MNHKNCSSFQFRSANNSRTRYFKLWICLTLDFQKGRLISPPPSPSTITQRMKMSGPKNSKTNFNFLNTRSSWELLRSTFDLLCNIKKLDCEMCVLFILKKILEHTFILMMAEFLAKEPSNSFF